MVPSPELEDTAGIDVSARERFSVLPAEFGRFRVLEKLGEGGFARVFRAELEGHEGFRKTVALKVIRPRDEKTDAALRDALTNEARLGALLRHTNTVDIYDFGEQDGLLYIAMEYVDGRPLDRLLAETGALPGPVLLDIAAQICAGLHHAHTLRDGGKDVTLIHRDLKPANILLTPDGVAKVADFGIAKALGERHERPATKAGVAKGTPPYMSPEQLRAETLTPASDLFAMGCIIYQLATGKLLFDGPSTAVVVLAIVQVQQRLAGGDIQAEADARVPGLGSVLEWCLQPHPEDRYPNAAALRSVLLDLRGRLGGGATLDDFLSGRDLEVLVGAAALETAAYRLEGSDVTDQGEHALKTPDLRKSNLPVRLDSFVGRGPELAELSEFLVSGASRLVTLLGAGGTGKTRLAQRFAARHLADFPGGAWFCDLTEVRSLDGLLGAVGAALEVPLTGRDPGAQLGDAILGRRRVLIVLDNFEQVVEHAAATVGAWLQRAPEARFLVTSRARLDLEGERLFPLEPLPVDEAVRLFEDRARAARPDFRVTDAARATVEDIVERLDCISLAVELAAARVRVLSPEKLLARLSQRFKLLSGGRRDQTARQATLRGAIDWSWELLKPWEQAALAQCSVFAGGFTLEAAEAVLDLESWEDAPWAMDVVQSLVDQSLVRVREPRPGCGRFGLYESIREYAAEKLAAAGASTAPDGRSATGPEAVRAAHQRHAEHYAALGTEEHLASLHVHGGVERGRLLGLEMENLVVAMDRSTAAGEAEPAAGACLAAMEVIEQTGPFLAGAKLAARVLELPGLAASQETRLLQKRGLLLLFSGRSEEGLVTLEAALAKAREERSRLHEGIVLGVLGVLHGEQGRSDEAREHFEAALAIHRQVGNRRSEGTELGNLGTLHGAQGRTDEAREHFEAALAIHREVGNRRNEGVSLGKLGNLHGEQGRPAEAREQCEAALAIHREAGDRRNEGAVLGNLGDLLLAQGETEAAETRLTEAVAVCDETWPAGAGAFRGSLALLRARQGAFDEARTLLTRGEQQLRGVYAFELGKLLCKRGEVERLAGDLDAARAARNEAASIGAGPDSELGRALAALNDALAR